MVNPPSGRARPWVVWCHSYSLLIILQGVRVVAEPSIRLPTLHIGTFLLWVQSYYLSEVLDRALVVTLHTVDVTAFVVCPICGRSGLYIGGIVGECLVPIRLSSIRQPAIEVGIHMGGVAFESRREVRDCRIIRLLV